jgi:hypothetical protein
MAWPPFRQPEKMPTRREGMLRFQRPQPLQENIPVAEKYERWLDWKGAFDVALSVCDSQPSEQQKAALLFTTVGPETQRTIRLLALPPMHQGSSCNGREYDTLSTGLNSFFRGMVDESVDYSRFHDASQEAAEGIHKYTLRLRALAASVNVAPSSFAFRHQLLKGMRDRELAVKAADDSIAIAELIQIAARKEQREASSVLRKPEPWSSIETQPVIAAVSANKGWKKRPRVEKRFATKDRDTGPPSKSKSCRYCGGRQHEDKKSCPAYGKECHECGTSNHFASVCEKRKKKISAMTQDERENSPADDAQVRTQRKN